MKLLAFSLAVLVPGAFGADSVANDGKGGRLTRKDTTSHLTWEKIPAK